MLKSEEEQDGGEFWESWTAENVDERASTKVLKVCSLVHHFKDVAAQPLFFCRDGSRDEAREALQVYPPAQSPRKILVFIEYAVHRAIMKKVSMPLSNRIVRMLTPGQALSLKGHKCLEYDGMMALKAREGAIGEFEKSKDATVMLISNVGTTGLNMTMASVVILVVSASIGDSTLVRGLT